MVGEGGGGSVRKGLESEQLLVALSLQVWTAYWTKTGEGGALTGTWSS